MKISKAHGEAISIAITALVCSYIDAKDGVDLEKVLDDRDEATRRLIALGIPKDKSYSEYSKRGKELSFQIWQKVHQQEGEE